MAKHLRLEDAFGDASHIHFDEAAVPTPRQGVDATGDQPLAGAVLAKDQHVRIGWSRALDERQHRPHGFGGRDEALCVLALQKSVLGAQSRVFRAKPPGLPGGLAESDLAAQHAREPRVVPGLLDEVARAAAHRLDRELDAAPGRHDDHRQLRVELPQRHEQCQTFLAGCRVARVVEIDERRREAPGRGGLQRGRWGLDAMHFVAPGFQEQSQRVAHVALVIGDEDSRNVSRHTLPS